MSHHVYAVILCGGSGTRFWPLSRRNKPKQFLNISGGGSLLQETIKRVVSLVPSSNIFLVTNKKFQQIIQKETAVWRIPHRHILLEPEGKNTAPAICWAALHIAQKDPQAIMVVLPSDHVMTQPKRFGRILRKALKLAWNNHLVTCGIVPTRPETGYGYLKVRKDPALGKNGLRVVRFTEKPHLNRAKQFIRSQRYLWNSGMFMWKVSVILEEFRRHLPKVYHSLSTVSNGVHLNKVWSQLPNISVDYGILEKAKDVVAVAAGDIGWSDLGSWEAVTEVLKKDRDGNILKGDVITVDSKNNFVWTTQRCIATIGVKDLVVIDTPDALLVCPKARSQDVRTLHALLKKQRHKTL